MPRITPFKQKSECKRMEMVTCARCLPIPDKFTELISQLPKNYSDYTFKDKETIYNIIEEILKNYDFTDFMVDVKEVPYGRYNSDSDYRGS